jgi:transposase-like protein
MSKIQAIKNYWLNQKPPVLSHDNYISTKYLIFDATYFHEVGCCAIVMNNTRKKIISDIYIDKERFGNLYPLLSRIKEQGVRPVAFTTDGHTDANNAIMAVFPEVVIQRCLYHIQRQGLSWLRTYPKTQAAKDLRFLLLSLTAIKTKAERDRFVKSFKSWFDRYHEFIKNLPNDTVAFKDLRRTVSLIRNALPNMFHYICNHKIAPTTNSAESFFSRLKSDFQRHRGLSEQHKIAYLKWYIYLKNHSK